MREKRRMGFTLSGTRWLDRYTGSRSALPCRHRKAAFTLAEVLITLAIIGVVAAITIPSLMALIGSKSDSARKEVIEDRLLDGLNRYSAMEDGLSLHYNTTKEFLDGLSKYYKMSQICDSDEITKCVPYSKINYEENDEVKSVDVSSLTTTTALISGTAADNYLPPASFITAQGTPVIIALKKGCTQDMGKAMTSIQTAGEGGCIALMYDKNGTGLPNRMGKDIVGMGLSPVKQPLKIVNGLKVMEKAFVPEIGLTKSECLAEIPKASEYTSLGFQTGITDCSNDIDRWSKGDIWAAAMKYCKEKGYHLPTEQESLKLIQGLLKDANGNHPAGENFYGYTLDTELAEVLGIKTTEGSNLIPLTSSNAWVYLWLSRGGGYNNIRLFRAFMNTYSTSLDIAGNYNYNRLAVCLGK